MTGTSSPASPARPGAASPRPAGRAAVHLTRRYDTDADDLWAAITEPERARTLARHCDRRTSRRWLGAPRDVAPDSDVAMLEILRCDRPHRLVARWTEDGPAAPRPARPRRGARVAELGGGEEGARSGLGRRGRERERQREVAQRQRRHGRLRHTVDAEPDVVEGADRPGCLRPLVRDGERSAEPGRHMGGRVRRRRCHRDRTPTCAASTRRSPAAIGTSATGRRTGRRR